MSNVLKILNFIKIMTKSDDSFISISVIKEEFYNVNMSKIKMTKILKQYSNEFPQNLICRKNSDGTYSWKWIGD